MRIGDPITAAYLLLSFTHENRVFCCRYMDSNWGPLVAQSTSLSTVPLGKHSSSCTCVPV